MDDKKPSTSRSRVGGIHTLADLNNNNNGDRPSSSDSDPDNTPQEYYTGGHKSGMLVQDPTKRNNISVADIFNRAREIGASTHTDAAAGADSPQQQQPQVVTHNIVFWTNGFTVDNGPLRRLDDPDNASFLESIKISECPKELEPADRRTPVNVNLIKKDQIYTEPEKSRVPFQGQGRTLGNAPPTPDVSAPPTSLNTAPPPCVGLAVARDLPSTSIQLRLADGTRMIAHFNVHHTVRDIRAFIDASRPGGSRNYNLQTVGFPPKQLTDPNQTIGEADLANSVIIQKL